MAPTASQKNRWEAADVHTFTTGKDNMKRRISFTTRHVMNQRGFYIDRYNDCLTVVAIGVGLIFIEKVGVPRAAS
jgi:hypothetical protein